jgi:hypothetical protein
MYEPDDHVRLLGDEERAAKRTSSHQADPHPTTNIYCRIELIVVEQSHVADPPSLGMGLADSLLISGPGTPDESHSFL